MGLILPQKVEVTITPNNVKYYESKGYSIPIRKATKDYMLRNKKEYCYDIGNKISINVTDMPNNSKSHVKALCDYCFSEIEIVWRDYVSRVLNSDIQKCCCKNCKFIKLEEYNMKKYNVPYYTSTDDFKKKQRSTFNKKYGVDYPLSLSGIHEKSHETMYKNGNYNSIASSQQKHIGNLYNGIINYPFLSYWLDVFLPNDNIDVEYDGKGHDLTVRTGKITQEEFNNKELVREKLIRENGYKVMRIISRKDKLPSDEKLLEILEYSRNYFKDNPQRSWIEFDVDNSTMRNALCKDNAQHYDFGELHTLPRKTA